MLLEQTGKALGKPDQRIASHPRGSLWEVGRHQVILGDCLDTLRTLPNASVDVVVTSPPYNIGVAYKTYHDKKPRESYLSWLSDVGKQLARVMRDDASFFLK